VLLAEPVFARGPPEFAQAAPREVPDELVVKMGSSTSRGRALDVLHAVGAELLDEIPGGGLHRVGVPAAAQDAVQRALERRPDVLFVERHQLLPPTLIPDDPGFDQQWHHAVVRSDQGWNWMLAAGEIIAILDSGVDATHPDLADAVLEGWDFWDGDGDPSDVHGHGTAVAGVAAAVTNNGEGVAGMAWEAAILPVRVAGPDGWASTWTIAQGLDYAVAQGAGVANLSFGGLASSQTVLAAAQSAVEAGTVVVGSAGNCGCTQSWPESPWILFIAATTGSDGLARFSTRGAFVDLAAPGQGMVTTAFGGGYASVSGTSFSAPLVAGLVALVLANEPTLTPAKVEERLGSTAVDLGAAGWDPAFGHGRVDVPTAVGLLSCGLGFELVLLMPPLMVLRRIRRGSPRPRA